MPTTENQQTRRGNSLATLRWVLGGPPVSSDTFLDGVEELPLSLRPLAADFALREGFDLPPGSRSRLLDLQRAATVASLARRVVMGKITTTFAAVGVPVVFLKGAALADQVYPTPSARMTSDIDVWVPGDDHSDAVAALLEQGFVAPTRRRKENELQGPAEEVALEFSVGGAPVLVEIHAPPASLIGVGENEIAKAWRSRRTVGPRRTPVLRLDHQLLHVCLHITRRHAFVGGLKAIVDVSMILRAWPSDPDDDALVGSFPSLARAWNATDAVFMCLTLADRLLGAPVPEAVLRGLNAGSYDALLVEAEDLLWLHEPKFGLGFVGGGGLEEGWLHNRMLLRKHLSAPKPESLGPEGKPSFVRVMKFWSRRVVMIGGFVVRGEVFRVSFWRRVSIVVRRVRLLRRLERAE